MLQSETNPVLEPLPRGELTRRAEEIAARHYDIPASQRTSVSVDTLLDWALSHRHDQADGYFLSCTALRTAELIAPLEHRLGRPVITSNQVMVWHALQSAGLRSAGNGWGALMRCEASA